MSTETHPGRPAGSTTSAAVRDRAGSLADVAIVALPAVLTVGLAFEAGGFFPGATGVAAVLVLAVLAVRVAVTPRALAGVGPSAAFAIVAMGLFVAWVWLSGEWGVGARAALEADRALLYLAVLALAAGPVRERIRMERFVVAMAAATVVVCGAGLISRTLPRLLEVSGGFDEGRLSYPLTYWNGMGMMAALGVVLCVHIGSSASRRVAARALATAMLPMLATTLLLTYSRGSIAAAGLGLLVYVIAGRDRGLPAVLACGGLASVIALIAGYGAEELAGQDPSGALAAEQGRGVAVVVGLCMVGAGVSRAALSVTDGLFEQIRFPTWIKPIGGVLTIAALAGAFLLVDGVDRVGDQYERFVEGDEISQTGDQRDRLANVGNNGRIEHWRVAGSMFASDRIKGRGAGTFANEWARERERAFPVSDAHSLPLELAGELGLVGLMLLGAVLAMVIGGLTRRSLGRTESAYAAALAGAIAWFAHACLDWDWEMPALTLWLFAAGGMALAAPAGPRTATLGRGVRLAIAAGLVVLCLTPYATATSQRHLDASLAALRDQRCGDSIRSALDSIDAVANRPEPYELIGFCESRLERHELAAGALDRARELDPDDWSLAYSAALVRGAGGRDPRPALARARRLNPREPLVLSAIEAFGQKRDPRTWRREARRADLPLQALAGQR